MTRAQHTAYRLRVLILLAGILYTVAAIVWLILPLFDRGAGIAGTPLVPGIGMETRGYIVNLLVVLGVIAMAQWAFLRPGRGWSARVATSGRPLKSALLAAGLMAMLLTIGLVSLLLELPDWWSKIIGSWGGSLGIWSAMLLAWGIWAWVFYVYWRAADHYTQMVKIVRGLVAGSLLEMLVALPVHLWITKSRTCYCARGTYTTLVLAGAVLLWAFGPGVFLLYMREKYHREKLLAGHTVACPRCDYDLRGTVRAHINRCPECGFRWD